MAASYTCDGCGCNVVKPKQVGHVLKRDYCEPCAERAAAFVEEEERIRKKAQKMFIEARNVLIAACTADGFKFPDVP